MATYFLKQISQSIAGHKKSKYIFRFFILYDIIRLINKWWYRKNEDILYKTFLV